MTKATALTVVVYVCLAYLLLVTLVAVAFLVVGAFENAVRKHDAESNDFAALESSRFTIPVSVIVAAYEEEVVIESTVRSLLAFDYPEFEVVVVNDGSSDGTLERLTQAGAIGIRFHMLKGGVLPWRSSRKWRTACTPSAGTCNCSATAAS